MFNAIWGILFVLVNFSFFLICYRAFGKYGLYAWIGVMTVLANVQVTKTIEMFGIVMTLGNTANASLFLSTDLLNERYGAKEARRAVWFGFFTLIMTTVIMQMALLFTPQPGDLTHESLSTIFGFMPRIAAGSLIAYFVSQFLDVKLFGIIKKKYGSRNQLWIRSNLSTGISQLVDSLVFCSIAFMGIYEWNVWLEIFITTYVVKLLVSVSSTPFLYVARNFKVNDQAL